MSRKGDKNVIPRAHSRKWAAFIAILFAMVKKKQTGCFAQCLSVGKNTGVNGVHGLSPFTV